MMSCKPNSKRNRRRERSSIINLKTWREQSGCFVESDLWVTMNLREKNLGHPLLWQLMNLQLTWQERLIKLFTITIQFLDPNLLKSKSSMKPKDSSRVLLTASMSASLPMDRQVLVKLIQFKVAQQTLVLPLVLLMNYFPLFKVWITTMLNSLATWWSFTR